MLRRLMSSLKSRFTSAPERDEQPTENVDELIDEARVRDQQLRNEAAKLIATKIVLLSRIRKTATEVGGARGLARRALLEAAGARRLGDEEAVSQWSEDARVHATRVQAGEEHLAELSSRYRETATQAEEARQAMEENASSLRDLDDQHGDMANVVQRTVSAVSTTIEDATPTPTALNDEIERVETEAEADAVPYPSRIDEQKGGEMVDMTEADSDLEALKEELGL